MSEPPISPGSPERLEGPPTPEQGSPNRRTPLLVVAAAVAVVLVLVLAVAVGIYGLLGRAGEPTAQPTTETSPTAEPTSPDTATVGQYAGLVNAEATDLRETWAYFEECSLDEDLSVACVLRILSLDMQAQLLVLVLDGAMKPGVPAYIGAPPPEIEALVADTREAAQALDDVIDDPAEADTFEVYLAGSRLMRVLDRWEPYI